MEQKIHQMFPLNSSQILSIQKAKYNMEVRVIFLKVSTDIPGTAGISFRKNNRIPSFILRLCSSPLYGDTIRVKYVFITDVLQLTLRTAIWFDHSLFMYIVLHFEYTLEISLKWRSARTGIWLLIHCLLWFDVDSCWMILSVVLVGFTVKLQTRKTGLKETFYLIRKGERAEMSQFPILC